MALQTPVRGAQVLWLVCLCSSLSVCLSAKISPELHVWSLPIVWCMLPTVVARSFSGEGGEVCYLRLLCFILVTQSFVIEMCSSVPARTNRLCRRSCRPVSATPHLLSDITVRVWLSITPALQPHLTTYDVIDHATIICSRL